MEYELYNILKNLYKKNLIFMYRYTYRNSKFYAMMPTKYKNEALKNKIIKQEDIVNGYDFDSLINNSYAEYC